MGYFNFTQTQWILRRFLFFLLIFLFFVILNSQALAVSNISLNLYNGTDWSNYYTSNGTYTPNLHQGAFGGYVEGDGIVEVYSEGIANYRSIGVWARIDSDSSVYHNTVGVVSAQEEFTLTGGTIGSTVNLSWLIYTSGLITYEPTTYGSFLIGLDQLDENGNYLNGFQYQYLSDGSFASSFLTPDWTYEIGKIYNINFYAYAFASGTNGFGEVLSTHTFSFPGVDIFTDQQGINVVTGSGEKLDVYYNVDNPFSPVPEPSTMLLLGSGLVGLVGFGRRRLKT